MLSESQITAFMEDPDQSKPNAIHSTMGAKKYGFSAALVGGVTAYGWCAKTIIDALGQDWLSHGWADISFKRPIYPGDELVVRVDSRKKISVTKLTDGSDCFGGVLGLGDAPWLETLKRPTNFQVDKFEDRLPTLTLEDAPVGKSLRTLEVSLNSKIANLYCTNKLRESVEVFLGSEPIVHPAWIAEQPIHWLHHSYEYGPAIHTRSKIQHLAALRAEGPIRIAGICSEVYERKGHHYIVNDTALIDQKETVFAQIQHQAIFRVAKR